MQRSRPEVVLPKKPARLVTTPRRWFQFSLRTLLILMTVIAVGLGWWTHKAHQQREAVAALLKVEATVDYDYRLPWTGWLKPNEPKWTSWFRDSSRVDFFASVGSVGLTWSPVTDGDLSNLQSLTSLQSLVLDNTQVADAGLENIPGLTNLYWLDLYGTKVTDAGLENLKDLDNLRHLNLMSTKVTNTGLTRLQKSLPNCKITPAPMPIWRD